MAVEEKISTTDPLKVKIDNVTDANIQDQLVLLRSDIACKTTDGIEKLRSIIKAKEGINTETRKQLEKLLIECSSSSEILPEGKSAFEQVFDGTRSEMFSSDGISTMKGLIDASFDGEIYQALQPAQRENIRLAMTDRLLKDPNIQKLFAMKIGVVDILGNMMKSDGPKDPKDVEEAKKSPSVAASISQAEQIFGTIQASLATATKPLVELLKKNKNPIALLSNPKALAEYDGRDIQEDISAMSDVDLKEYIKGLNGNIRKIDDKVFPMELIKEKGMNFLANAPSFLVDFFKWLLSFDFIAKLFGYKGDQDEREAQFDDERQQRRSLGILREFGKVVPLEGPEREGEHAGKIKMLEGRDLSKLNRKGLTGFFTFTKEEGIDTTTPAFWIEVFNKGKITIKGKEGKGDVVFDLKLPITSDDLEKNFKGLYEKLNGLLVEKQNKIKIEADKVVNETKAEADKVVAKQAEEEKVKLTAQKATLERVNMEMKSYKDISDGLIINKDIEKLLASLVLKDFIDGTYKTKADSLLNGIPKKDEIIRILSTYSNLLSSNDKVRTHMSDIQGIIDFKTISYQRRIILNIVGYTEEKIKEQEKVVVEVNAAEEKIRIQAEKLSYLQKRDSDITSAISSATVFPVTLPSWDAVTIARGKELQIEYPSGKIDFDASKEELYIGDIKFSLKVKPYTTTFLFKEYYVQDGKITKIETEDENFKFIGWSAKYKRSGDPTLVKKIEMPKLILALLNNQTKLPEFAEKMEIKRLT